MRVVEDNRLAGVGSGSKGVTEDVTREERVIRKSNNGAWVEVAGGLGGG